METNNYIRVINAHGLAQFVFFNDATREACAVAIARAERLLSEAKQEMFAKGKSKKPKAILYRPCLGAPLRFRLVGEVHPGDDFYAGDMN